MRLSAFETFMNTLACHRIYNNFIVGAQFKPILTTNKIANAVSKLCKKYPQFSLTVADDHHSEYLKKYNVRDCIEIIDNSNPQQILEKYTALHFDYRNGKPNWKLVLDSNSNTLFFVADHTYLDGTAAKNAYSEICKSLDDQDIDIDNIENNIIEPKFGPYHTSAEMMKFEERSIDANPNVGTSPPLDHSLLNSPYYKHTYQVINLNKEKSEKLLKIARENGFKFTGLIYSIASKAILNSYKDTGEFNKLRSLILINSRFRIHSKANELFSKFGLFFGFYYHYDDISFVKNSNISEIGKKFQIDLNENMDNCLEFWENLETHSLRDKSIIENAINSIKLNDSKPTTTLEISNIGLLNSDKISKVYFDQPMFDSAFGLHLFSSNDYTSLNFTSHRGLPKEIHEKYVNNTMNIINDLLNKY